MSRFRRQATLDIRKATGVDASTVADFTLPLVATVCQVCQEVIGTSSISTRRFAARPSSVSFEAIGRASPYP